MTSIEYLPNELWLEIFSYITSWDLFLCFSGLNERIHAIVYSKRLRVHLKNALVYSESKFLMKIYSDYIVGIRISYRDQDIDISPFKNLVSIHLSNATDEQLKRINPNYFQDLNQLNIVVCSTNQHFENILFGQNQFEHLTKCWFPTLNFDVQHNERYQPCLTLRSLRLNFCSIDTFPKLLSLLPNLIRFESALIPSPSSLGQSNLSPIIEHLTILCLKLLIRDHVSLIDLETVFSCVPRLERLYLTINKPRIPEAKFDSIQLASIVKSRVPNLKKCGIKINLLSTILKMNLHDSKNISPLFTQVNEYSS